MCYTDLIRGAIWSVGIFTQRAEKAFWYAVCNAVSGRPGSAEAIRLFQLKEPASDVLASLRQPANMPALPEPVIVGDFTEIPTQNTKKRSSRPNRGMHKRRASS